VFQTWMLYSFQSKLTIMVSPFLKSIFPA
jgi:hypothetical protein